MILIISPVYLTGAHHYCGDLFILPFLDIEILENHYIGEEENKDTILTLFDQFKVNFLDYLAHYKLDLYC